MGRRALLLALLLVPAASMLPALPAAGGHARASSSFYVVRQDPRLCPSPLCGGYWVERANQPRTRCADDRLHPRCYVARAVDARGEEPASPIPQEALVKGTVDPGRDDLGALVVARRFAPVGRGAASGRYFRVVDLGIRCVRAPCFSLRARLLNHDQRLTLSGVGVSAAPGDARRRIEALLGSESGVLTRGRIVRSADGGRELRPTRFYLPSEG